MRRKLLAVCAGLTALTLTVGVALFVTTRREPPEVRYVTPDGAGRGDGSSWRDAGTLGDLPRFVAALPPGGEVWIHGDLGAYQHSGPIVLSDGGAAGAPIVIRGVDASGGRSARALITGSRSDPYRPGGRPGQEVFRLSSGADHLRFEGLGFANQGNGCFRIAADITDLTIRDVTADNVRRFIENTHTAGESSASVDGLVVTDVAVRGFSKGAIRLRYDSHDVLLEDVYGDSQRQDRDNFAMGVALSGTVHDVVHRRVTMLNSHDSNGKYWNGDGFTAEPGTYDLRYEDTYAGGHTDGGYDLKSSATTLTGAVAEDNKRNFRFWGQGIAVNDCVGRDPNRRGGSGTQAQVHATARADVVVHDCVFTDRHPATIVFDVDRNAQLSVQGGVVRHHPSAQLRSVESAAELDVSGLTVNGGSAAAR